MLVVFAAGVERVEVYGGCVFVSVLIHYFTLVAVMWMGAEALLMFQKLVIVFMRITTKFLVILSLVCWCKLIKNLCTLATIAKKLYAILLALSDIGPNMIYLILEGGRERGRERDSHTQIPMPMQF